MFFFRKKFQKGPLQPKIEVIVRHCVFSDASKHKKRPPSFSRELCHQNLLETADSRVNFTFFLDLAKGDHHFLKGQAIEIKEGTEASSFLKMLDWTIAQDFHPDTIIYFLEDDYLHKPGWVDILVEAFSLDADYVTLYDHPDKYRDYPDLTSKIFISKSCHWRTTPSTTNTYAMRFGTLKQDLAIHRKFSLGRKISADHAKFCHLQRKGARLISPMPGWSTHVELEFVSPFFNEESLCKR
jgi:hypothetical protein